MLPTIASSVAWSVNSVGEPSLPEHHMVNKNEFVSLLVSLTDEPGCKPRLIWVTPVSLGHHLKKRP